MEWWKLALAGLGGLGIAYVLAQYARGESVIPPIPGPAPTPGPAPGPQPTEEYCDPNLNVCFKSKTLYDEWMGKCYPSGGFLSRRVVIRKVGQTHRIFETVPLPDGRRAIMPGVLINMTVKMRGKCGAGPGVVTYGVIQPDIRFWFKGREVYRVRPEAKCYVPFQYFSAEYALPRSGFQFDRITVYVNVTNVTDPVVELNYTIKPLCQIVAEEYFQR